MARARTDLEERLRPAPFSERKLHRLRELKVAKQTAEDRLRGHGSNHRDWEASSLSTVLSICDDVDMDRVVIRNACTLVASMAVRTALVTCLGAVEWASTTAAQDSIDIALVTLQATALCAFLNTVLNYSFVAVDFGQKELISNMNNGKRLFVKEVNKYSRITAALVALLSCMYGLVEGVSRELLCPESPVPDAPDRWGSKALGVSSLYSSRIGVFVISLVFMGKILLPKQKEKSLRKKSKQDTPQTMTVDVL